MQMVLKRLALAAVSDKRVRDTVLAILLGFLIFAVMPVSALCEFFSESEDAGNFFASIVSKMPENQQREYERMESVFSEIEKALSERDLSGRAEEAKAIYLVFLYEKGEQPGFAEKLADCFEKGGDTDALIEELRKAFGISVSDDDLKALLSAVREDAINLSGYENPKTKNAHDLALWARRAKNAGWGYVWGTYGEVLTGRAFQQKLRQYPAEIGAEKKFISENYLGKRTADCVGLIKGYLWLNPETKRVEYGRGRHADVGADGMFEKAKEKGTISSMPKIQGIAVWQKGHIGIYVGDGKVIEAANTRAGILETRLSAGTWTHWLKVPGVRYE